MFKKILNAIINSPVEENSNKIEAAPDSEQMIVRPYTPQDNEEISKLLTNFDTATLMTHIITLEKVVVNLASKVEMQSELLCTQSSFIKDMHSTLEEVLYELSKQKPNSDNVVSVVDSNIN